MYTYQETQVYKHQYIELDDVVEFIVLWYIYSLSIIWGVLLYYVYDKMWNKLCLSCVPLWKTNGCTTIWCVYTENRCSMYKRWRTKLTVKHRLYMLVLHVYNVSQKNKLWFLNLVVSFNSNSRWYMSLI